MLFLIPISAYADTNGSIAVTLVYTNGDTADYWPISLEIYQDNDQIPYKKVESITGNPFNIISLPMNHQYKIIAYANSMYSSVAYVNLQQSHQDVTIKIPLPGGLRINAFYNDGITPIVNATVYIKSSQDNKTWAHGPTNTNGGSLRFWIEPTTRSDDHYIAEIHVGNHLLYSESPIYLRPGIAQEVKVTTKWPPIINSLVTVKVFNSQSHPILPSDGKFLVQLFDSNDNKIAESPVNSRGEAYFSNIKVGDYTFTVVKTDDNSEWAGTTIIEDGTVTSLQILQTHNNKSDTIHTNTISLPKPNCNCVAFRLDNVQDYWLDDVQIKIIDSFGNKDAEITAGIIGNVFGDDAKLVSYLKSKTDIGMTDIATNGWSFEDFTTYTRDKQSSLLQESKTKISTALDVTPTIFIPPYGKVNNDTIYAVSSNNITTISSGSGIMIPQDFADKISNYPANVFVGALMQNSNQSTINNKIFAAVNDAVKKDGYAVIALNFQDYAQVNGTTKIDIPDTEKIQSLTTLIDNIRSQGYRITTVSKISNFLDTEHPFTSSIYSWSQDKISNTEFLNSIKSSINDTVQNNYNFTTVPSWLKHNAVFYENGQISDEEFIDAIKYLIKVHAIE